MSAVRIFWNRYLYGRYLHGSWQNFRRVCVSLIIPFILAFYFFNPFKVFILDWTSDGQTKYFFSYSQINKANLSRTFVANIIQAPLNLTLFDFCIENGQPLTFSGEIAPPPLGTIYPSITPIIDNVEMTTESFPVSPYETKCFLIEGGDVGINYKVNPMRVDILRPDALIPKAALIANTYNVNNRKIKFYLRNNSLVVVSKVILFMFLWNALIFQSIKMHRFINNKEIN